MQRGDEAGPDFEFLEFNGNRAMRGAAAARVRVSKDGDWLWMTREDVRANIANFGRCDALVQALQCYERAGGYGQGQSERPAVSLSVELEGETALALAQLVKRLTWRQLRECAISETECEDMRDAVVCLSRALADAGVQVR